MTSPMAPPCAGCAHYIGKRKCRAFVKEIPNAIWVEGNDHREPYPGDNGIRFEPLQDANDRDADA